MDTTLSDRPNVTCPELLQVDYMPITYTGFGSGDKAGGGGGSGGSGGGGGGSGAPDGGGGVGGAPQLDGAALFSSSFTQLYLRCAAPAGDNPWLD